ncbi:ricin-type beta-trefoil lectin domain protein [Streptomyces sp. NPDC003703]|uniref:ricin-type beta-trefoil lectin domain protein n=1 Tax=Streptomyces sp. NPDC003283 TaxID=3364681 RepID=UPI0036D1B20E
MKSPHPPPDREVPREVPVAAPPGEPAPDALSSRTEVLPIRSRTDRRTGADGPVTGGGLPKRRRGAPDDRFGSGPAGGGNESGDHRNNSDNGDNSDNSADSSNSADDSGRAGAGPARERGTLPRLTQFSSLGRVRGSAARGTAAFDRLGAPEPAGHDGGEAPGGRRGGADPAGPSGPAPGGFGPRTPPRGKRRGLLIAAAAVAVALIAGTAVTLARGGGDSPERGSTGGAYGAHRPDVEDLLPDLPGSSSPSASFGGPSKGTASASPSDGKPRPTSSGSATAKDGGSAPDASGAATAPAASGDPGAGPGAGGSGPGPDAGAGAVRLRSHSASGRCISVAGGQGKDGAPLDIRDCSGAAAQQWTFAPDGTVRSMGLCMDAAGARTSDGTTVQLANCNGNPAQRFALNSHHDLVSGLADKCVDIRDNRTANGSRLQLWTCAGTPNQKWSSA